MAEPLLAVVNVTGNDQKGVVARISTHLAERSVNIEDIEQHVVHGLFIMNMLVDIRDMSIRLDELITGLIEIGAEIGMEIKVHLHTEPRRLRLGSAAGVMQPPKLRSLVLTPWKPTIPTTIRWMGSGELTSSSQAVPPSSSSGGPISKVAWGDSAPLESRTSASTTGLLSALAIGVKPPFSTSRPSVV